MGSLIFGRVYLWPKVRGIYILNPPPDFIPCPRINENTWCKKCDFHFLNFRALNIYLCGKIHQIWYRLFFQIKKKPTEKSLYWYFHLSFLSWASKSYPNSDISFPPLAHWQIRQSGPGRALLGMYSASQQSAQLPNNNHNNKKNTGPGAWHGHSASSVGHRHTVGQ